MIEVKQITLENPEEIEDITLSWRYDKVKKEIIVKAVKTKGQTTLRKSSKMDDVHLADCNQGWWF